MNISPKTATTFKKLLTLKRDNVAKGDFWFLTDVNAITIAQQKIGEPAKVIISLPKNVFNRFVKFYTEKQ